jgi:hypothetical protein
VATPATIKVIVIDEPRFYYNPQFNPEIATGKVVLNWHTMAQIR